MELSRTFNIVVVHTPTTNYSSFVHSSLLVRGFVCESAQTLDLILNTEFFSSSEESVYLLVRDKKANSVFLSSGDEKLFLNARYVRFEKKSQRSTIILLFVY